MSKKKQETMNTGVYAEFTTNSNGVTIKKCCASCKYKQPHDSEGPRRACTKHQEVVDDKVRDKIVDKRDLCSDWVISEEIDRIKVRGAVAVP